MQSLQTLVSLLTKGRQLHISVLDLSGILTRPETELDTKNVIHSKPICDMAKSTQEGYRACVQNKTRANRKAIECGEGFCGHCIYGIFEYAMPIVINQRTVAIVYIGNAVTDEDKTKKKIKAACNETGVSESAMLELIKDCERVSSPDELRQIAEIVGDYLRMLHTSKETEAETEAEVKGMHWMVTLMKQYAEENFTNTISLGDIASLYDRNEKYIGRLFKTETGITFSEYCNELRLERATKLITERKKRIIDIATECGFENVTYFNRLFKKRYGVSPLRWGER